MKNRWNISIEIGTKNDGKIGGKNIGKVGGKLVEKLVEISVENWCYYWWKIDEKFGGTMCIKIGGKICGKIGGKINGKR